MGWRPDSSMGPLVKPYKMFAIYRDGVFFGAVKIDEDEEQRRILALMEAGRKGGKHGTELHVKEAKTIPFDEAIKRLERGRLK